jgi:hypothetical protein
MRCNAISRNAASGSRRAAGRERARPHDALLLATAAGLAKAREKRKNSCRFGVHSENPGDVYFLY